MWEGRASRLIWMDWTASPSAPGGQRPRVDATLVHAAYATLPIAGAHARDVTDADATVADA